MASALRRPKHPMISMVESCISLREIKQIHTQLLINGFFKDKKVLSQFISSIALNHPTNVEYAHQFLDQCNFRPTLRTLNWMIKAYSETSTPQMSFHLYNTMLHPTSRLLPDNCTFNFLVRACAKMMALDTGASVHAALLKYGFGNDPYIQEGLISMYAEFGLLNFACLLFDEISEPSLVVQTTMMSACAKSGYIRFARQVFDNMLCRDTVAWNVIMLGYSRWGKPEDVLKFFYLMQKEGVKADKGSMVLVLSACTHLVALDEGRKAHTYIEENKLGINVHLGTALLDMYAKCGVMNKAMEVFSAMKEKNIYTWTSAINGLATSGAGKAALELFGLMKQEGVQPNEVTFLCVLKGCSAAGLVEEGRELFESMRNICGLEPKLEHYGCMVDLYGRVGLLHEALNFIDMMPMKPNMIVWGALANACNIYGNKELGELASRKMVELRS